ncbi:hypothetical protein [Amycolatopsis sp. WGS_07]|uniref:hypothetical protein n=1 Tax=Amycolatopsis sp. WGS_07 TaxID=3076764 RepID=UPI003873A1D5
MSTLPEVPNEPLPEYEHDFAERARRAIAAAHRLTDQELADTDVPVLVQSIMDRHVASPVVPRFDLKWNDAHEPFALNALSSTAAHPLRIELHVPCDGAAGALFASPDRAVHTGGNSRSLGTPRGGASEPQRWRATVGFTLDETAMTSVELMQEGLRQAWESYESALVKNVKAANDMIDKHRAEVGTTITAIVATRRARLVALRSASANLAVPLVSISGPLVTVPVVPRMLTLSQVEQAHAAGTPDYTLADDIADSIVAMIDSFGLALERLPTTAGKLLGENEESIRDLLLFLLNSNYDGLAAGETFNGAGKTDILLRWNNKNAFIAECKIWHGERKFAEAIDQLLGYTVWRDTRVALVLFIRDRIDVSGIVDKAVAVLRQHAQYLSEPSGRSSETAREFTLSASTDIHRAIRLTLIPVALPRS